MLCNIKVVTLTPNFVKKSNKIEKYKNDFMKKLILSGSALALVLTSLTANSQQLPNIGFENWKTKCGETTTTVDNKSFVRPGVEPEDWSGSNVTQVMQFPDFVKKEEKAPYSGKTSLLLTNQKPGLATLSAPAPAFVTMGTPWIFAKIAFDQAAINMGDGGVYGGVAFSNTPDAITGMYKRDNSAGTEDAHIISYLWAGTYKSRVRSAIEKQNGIYVETATMELDDVDRAILGKSPATQTGTLVASCDYLISGKLDQWTEITVPFKYESQTVVPEKMNVIVSAADYWTRANIVPNNTLTVDDVKFVYYSRLASLTVGGVPVEGFASDKYEYEIPAALPATTDGIAYTVLGDSPAKKVEVVRDEAASAIKVIVTNTNAGADAVDADGQKSHTYTLKYVYTVTDYPGYLTVGFGEGYLAANKVANVQIVDKKNGKCDFVLPNFELFPGSSLGDIVIPDATTSVDGMGTTTYAGEVKGMELVGGIVADVALDGTIDKQGKVDMTVDVVWLGNPIPVTFTTEKWQMKESGYYFVVNSDDYQHPLAEKVATQLTILPESAPGDGSNYLNCKLTLNGVKFTDGTAVDFGNLTVSGIQQLGDRNVVAKTYEGTATNVALGNGETAETVVVSGSRTENNQYELKFAVTVGGKTRDIVFTTEAVSSGVEAVEGAEAVVYGIADGIVVEGFAGEVVVYAADGRLVKVAEGNMTVAVESGLYLVRTGAKVTKVIVK